MVSRKYTTKDDIAFLKRNKTKIIGRVGESTYNFLLETLERYGKISKVRTRTSRT